MTQRLTAPRLVALFASGVLLFTFPLLRLWDHDVTWLGLPLFPAALFAIWLAWIGAVAWVVERSDGGESAEGLGAGSGAVGHGLERGASVDRPTGAHDAAVGSADR